MHYLSSIKEGFTGSGYDPEELYFYEINRELIRKLREQHRQRQPSDPPSSREGEALLLAEPLAWKDAA
jgi:hypothetical protein